MNKKLNDVKPVSRNLINNVFSLYDPEANKVNTITDYKTNTIVELENITKISGFESAIKSKEKVVSDNLNFNGLKISKALERAKISERTPHKTLLENGIDKNIIEDKPSLNKVFIKLNITADKITSLDPQYDQVPNVKKTVIKY